MRPDDRVLVAYLPRPADLVWLRAEGWYRIPYQRAPKGLYAEYYAFYFGRQFGRQKYAIHYFARYRGHELLTRLELLPDEPEHPRAQSWYLKVQLGPLQQLATPIVSLRWRRITFLRTTGDRFMAAREINDLVLAGDSFVDRRRIGLE